MREAIKSTLLIVLALVSLAVFTLLGLALFISALLAVLVVLFGAFLLGQRRSSDKSNPDI